MLRPVLMVATALLLGADFTTAASAAPATDPAGDFLPSFAGPQGGDLDVLSVAVRRSATSFTLSSIQAADIGTTPGGFYVWGIDRGQGTERFGALAPGVRFDSVLILRPDGTGNFADLLNAANSFALAPGAISISGATITGTVAIAAIPTTGFAAPDYTFNLWPRSPGSGTSFISDFAPDASNVGSFVPEPGSWALLIAGFGITGATLRRRRALVA
jgi:PEP-CTERM motif